MTQHMDAWLTAYYDGELSGRRQREVEAHLATCEACQARLEDMAALSTLLLDAPEPVDLTPPERFVAQVQLQLPRRPVEPGCRRRAVDLSWNLAPLAVFAVWAFFQAVVVISAVVEVVLERGWGGEPLARVLEVTVRAPEWVLEISTANQVTFRVLAGSPFEVLLPINLWLTLLVSLFAGVWLALWFMRQQRMGDELGE